MDLKGAYTLISFNPVGVQYVCIEVDSNLLMFFLSGVFGWSGSQSVADENTEIGQRITFIGYDWDLVSRQKEVENGHLVGVSILSDLRFHGGGLVVNSGNLNLEPVVVIRIPVGSFGGEE
eukprot:gene53051-70924_t